MKKIIGFKFAGYANLVIYALFIVFHVLAVAGVVPPEILWGGRLETREQLVVFELVSIAMLLVFGMFTALRLKFTQPGAMRKISGAFMWIGFALFTLNSVGNVFAETSTERMFVIVTLLLAIFSLRLALGEKKA